MRARTSRRGNFAILMAFSFSGFLAMGAVAVDLYWVRNVRAELSNATDAAAHAALVELRRTGNITAATDLAIAVAGANTAGGESVTLPPGNVEFGIWDFDDRSFSAGGSYTNAVRVRAVREDGGVDGPIQTFVAPTVGLGDGDGDASATAAFRFRDMVIVQDVTGSFSRSLDKAREADLAFLDYVYGQGFPQDRLGMVTFTGGAQEFTPIQTVSGSYSATRSQWYGDGVATYNSVLRRYNTKTAGLTICYKPRSSAPYNASWMQRCSLGGDYTNPGSGLELGMQKLQALGASGNTKVIVFVSDGRPQCASTSYTDPCTAGRIQYAYDTAADIQAAGIHTFVVSFCEDCNASQMATQFAFNEQLVTGMGRAYSTPDASDLPDILLDIAAAIPLALVE